jgi:hypothetical protein
MNGSSGMHGIEGTGLEGTDEITTIRRTTLRLFGMLVSSSVPSMSVRLMSGHKWQVFRSGRFPGQTDSLSEIDLTQPTINDLQAIAD